MSDTEPEPLEDLPLGDIETTPSYENSFIDYTIEDAPPQDEAPVSDKIEEGGVFDDATTPVGDGACAVCGAPTFRPPGLTKGGRRKRVPKFCDLHNPNVKVNQSFDGFQQAQVESQLRKIQVELADDLRLLGTLTGPLFPVTGYYIIDNADPFTTALLKLCKNNTRMLRVLHRAAQVAPVYEVAKVGAGVAYAVQVDQKKADPQSVAAHRLGVTQAYYTVYPNETPMYNNGNNFREPPKYATVQ